MSRWRARTRWRPRRCRSSGTLHLEAHSGRDTASVAWVHRVHVRANINVYLSGRELQIKQTHRVLKLKESKAMCFFIKLSFTNVDKLILSSNLLASLIRKARAYNIAQAIEGCFEREKRDVIIGTGSLPENGILPCARIFAVCIISGTRRRPPLPCVSRRTHGKEKTHGKPYSSPCAKGQHTANLDLRRVSASRHTANMDHVRGTPFCRQGASRPLLFAVCQG